MGESRSDWTRRHFLQTSAGVVAGGALAQAAVAQDKPKISDPRPGAGPRPVVISSANGLKAIDKAMDLLRGGKDPLDAVIAAVNIVEDDPNDHSVGLGGLPNEDGVVELDSSVMHGPTHKAGAVAALRNIKNPSKVARLVMGRTDHVLIVGEGALRFAKAHGFKEEELLTEEARKIWLKWKESHARDDDWLSPEEAGAAKRPAGGARGPEAILHTWGTINCCAVDAKGDLAGVTTTSGLSYKIPGRVGDSPIIGAGLYVDNAVGAAGSTGRGEANLQNCTSFLVVEFMRSGKSPEEACVAAMQRVADHAEPRLRDKMGRPDFDLKLYAVAKDGRYGGASMWFDKKPAQFAVHDGTTARLVECRHLYRK
ncbi:MAG TPA: N(4)-(beta-N-acetylglucosaminyl)-L-asparaginase [Phycisphaerae bacterium]|nr:N(4)-(beta-N-acetylglucosaminyl)-L-asparaginase [Phycisphaerae bacterium]